MTLKVLDADTDRLPHRHAPDIADKPIFALASVDPVDLDGYRRRLGCVATQTENHSQSPREGAVSRLDANLLRSFGIDPGDVEDILNGRSRSALFHPLRPRPDRSR